MRWLHTAVIIVLIFVTFMFAVQNLQSVTISFLNFGISAPLAILGTLFYLLGMVTGGSAWALIRWAAKASKQASDA